MNKNNFSKFISHFFFVCNVCALSEKTWSVKFLTLFANLFILVPKLSYSKLDIGGKCGHLLSWNRNMKARSPDILTSISEKLPRQSWFVWFGDWKIMNLLWKTSCYIFNMFLPVRSICFGNIDSFWNTQTIAVMLCWLRWKYLKHFLFTLNG